ncbi:auxilin-related protein 2-like isoform X2 [Telopea speciosissima]|uniref:auxilin-related protein 2-like isoform X2 n=1 Tax=Telopea speciosissima TaxID=54955 RepID=UPI001CC5A962|nr:auxilin-related protein 2-like isoform X2 [Telopea speciosissima]
MDDEFPGLLARDFGHRPQGKSAPMSASKSTGGLSSGGNLNFGIGSGGDSRSSSVSSNRSKSAWTSNSAGGSFLDDHDGLFGSTGNQKTQNSGGFGSSDDVFGGPPKYDNRGETRGGASSASSFDYDSIFQGSKDSGSKFSSLPVFDKPKYDDDDDIFHGLPGVKNSSSTAKKDDVFASISSPPKQSAPFDDLLGSFIRKDPDSKSSSGRRSEEVGKDFDDLIPGFGGSSPLKNRATSEANQPQQSTAPSTKSTSRMMDDLFVVSEPTSSPTYPPSGLFADPLEQMSKPNNSGSAKFVGSAGSGTVLDDMDPLDSLGKSVPLFSTEVNKKGREKSPLRAGSMDASAGKESNEKPYVRASENASQKKVPVDNYRESHQTLFDIPSGSSNSNKPTGYAGSRPSFVNANSNGTNSQADMSPTSEENLEAADDVWLTVSEIPLFTQPTSAPPPSRPPPPRPAQVSKRDKSSFAPVNMKKKVSELPTFSHSTQSFQSPKTVPDSAKSSGVSSIYELEDFAMDRSRSNVDEHADILSSEEDIETNSAAAAAMKEAMDRAEAKFKHAREVRERDNVRAARSREPAQQDAHERELREKQERLDREREQEREEKEREQRRLERERERAREIEREKARQAVERATKEARERAAAEARLKAERAAVERAKAEARERAERAAVQRAQAEARERAAIDARERAERAAAEARLRAAAEAREKEAQERAAVARAEAEVRLRTERAAVERAAAEARERAAAEARERAAAAAAAKENQQKNDNDLESFFNNMGARPSSAPRPRPNSSNPFETQFQNKGGSEAVRRTSSGTSSTMKKASSSTNIVEDLSSIFSPSREFREIDGESEERRRARWERHQRTQERAAKALAEKNQRDLQIQHEQAERHRIAETLDIEIKRWAAGKEGNLRALLSTLQYVLWPECGWQPVSLTDLITGASVKKVYRKATLCIHPDKVQQKGANLQQKYIAEKVFDLLKEAWNKFNSEELF